MKNDDLLHKWHNGTISAVELEEFKKRPEYASLFDLRSQTEVLEGPTFDNESMLAHILASKEEQVKADTIATPIRNEEAKVFRLPSLLKYGMAAAILCLLGLFIIPKGDMVTYEIASAQEAEGTLPDQSTFKLFENSKLTYDADRWENSRDVNLEGKAFFKVQKGSNFAVHTDNGIVTVLGTEFIVNAEDTILSVSCAEGKVSVKSGGRYDEILVAGESMELDTNGKAITQKQNLTKMKQVTLADVLGALKEKYRITFNMANVDISEKLSCNFQHTDLELALKTTMTPLGITYTQDDTIVSLVKK